MERWQLGGETSPATAHVAFALGVQPAKAIPHVLKKVIAIAEGGAG